MINLLPPDIKQSIVYARRNTKLRRWCIALVLCVLSIGAIVGVGSLYLQQSVHSYSVQVQQGNDDLKAQKLDETQSQIQSITDSLKLVVQVLSREILFSKLLSQIGSSLPSGAILTDLNINKIQGGIDLKAQAIDYQHATQVQLNLQDPTNKIFDKADIVSITCDSKPTDPVTTQYPCIVQVRALFTKNNPYLFINPTSTKATP